MNYSRAWTAKAKNVFGMDTRSMALFRIALASFILIDLVNRLADFKAFYTDSGVLPRAVVLSTLHTPWKISLHMMGGDIITQALLFLMYAVCAVGLLVGYRTRWMTFIAWLFALSLGNRNPLIERGGEAYFRFLLLWSIFIPLGARFSVDSFLDSSSQKVPQKIVNAGTAAILIQTFIVYLFAGLYKSKGVTWVHEGSALYYSLMGETLAQGPAQFLLLCPTLLKGLSRFTVLFELLAPFLLLSPYFTFEIRSVLIPCFWIFQLGIGLSLRLSPFPQICGLAMLVFIPAEWWDTQITQKTLMRVKPVWQAIATRGREFMDHHPTFFQRRALTLHYSQLENVGAVGLILFYLIWNFVDFQPAFARFPPGLMNIVYLMGMDHRWNAFAPEPPMFAEWFVIPGDLQDGSVIDLYKNGAPLSWTSPKTLSANFKDQCWQRYLTDMVGRPSYMNAYSRYLCREWNDSHPHAQSLKTVHLIILVKKLLPGYKIQIPQRIELYRYSCVNQQPLEIPPVLPKPRKTGSSPQIIMASPFTS